MNSEIGKRYELFVVDALNRKEQDGLMWLHGQDISLIHFIQIYDPTRELIYKYKTLPRLLHTLRLRGNLRTAKRIDSPLVAVDIYLIVLSDDRVVDVRDAKYVSGPMLLKQRCTSDGFFFKLKDEKPEMRVGYVTNVTYHESGIHLPVEVVHFDPRTHTADASPANALVPYGYQLEFIRVLRQKINEEISTAYIVSPTGSGKSFMVSETVALICEVCDWANDTPINILCPTVNLCDQMAASLEADLPISVQRVPTVIHCHNVKHVQAQIAKEQLQQTNTINIVVQKTALALGDAISNSICLVDEVHNIEKMYLNPPRLLIGFSAIVPKVKPDFLPRISYKQALDAGAIVPVHVRIPNDKEGFINPEVEGKRIANILIQEGIGNHLILAPLMHIDEVDDMHKSLLEELTRLVPDWFAAQFKRVEMTCKHSDPRLLRDKHALDCVFKAIEKAGPDAEIVTISKSEAIEYLGIDEAELPVVDQHTLVYHPPSGTMWKTDGVKVGVQTSGHKTGDLTSFMVHCKETAGKTTHQCRTNTTLKQAFEGINIPPLKHVIIAGKPPKSVKSTLQAITRPNRAYKGKLFGKATFSHAPDSTTIGEILEVYDPENEEAFKIQVYEVDVCTALQVSFDEVRRHTITMQTEIRSRGQKPLDIYGYNDRTVEFAEYLLRNHPKVEPPTQVIITDSGRRFKWKTVFENIYRNFDYKALKGNRTYWVVTQAVIHLPYSPLYMHNGTSQYLLPAVDERTTYKLCAKPDSKCHVFGFTVQQTDRLPAMGPLKIGGRIYFQRIHHRLVAVIDSLQLRSSYTLAPGPLTYDTTPLFDNKDRVYGLGTEKGNCKWPSSENQIDFETDSKYVDALERHRPILADPRLWSCVFEYNASINSIANHLDTMHILAKLQLGIGFSIRARDSNKRGRDDDKEVNKTVFFDCGGPINLTQNAHILMKMCEAQLKAENCERKDHTLQWVFSKMLMAQLYMLMALESWSARPPSIPFRFLAKTIGFADPSDPLDD